MKYVVASWLCTALLIVIVTTPALSGAALLCQAAALAWMVWR
jgi:hypothetical protein